MRILLLITLIWLVGWLAKSLFSAFLKWLTPPSASSEPLVKCKKCQVFIPQKQAFRIQGEYYCEQHASS